MKRWKRFLILLVLTSGMSSRNVLAGAPFNNLEGVGGVAFNPLAWLADSGGDQGRWRVGRIDVAGKPRLGGWYVNLHDAHVDWTSIGVAETFFKRVELSYGYQSINQEAATTRHKNNLGAKLLLFPENFAGKKFLPAISAGILFKHTSQPLSGTHKNGQDFYIVATKLITQLPAPLLLSGGVLSTKGRVTGVFGFDQDRRTTGFGNVDLILPWKSIVGFEFKQGARYSQWKDADYWNTHLAWTPNNHLSLILAYVYAGDHKSSRRIGLGDGMVLSAQYSF